MVNLSIGLIIASNSLNTMREIRRLTGNQPYTN